MALDTGLVASYNLNGVYTNTVGSGLYNGVVTGTVPFVTGVKGQAVSFSGSGSTNNVNIGKPVIAAQGTMCCWVYPTSSTGLQVALGDSALWKGILINYLSAGNITVYAFVSTARFVTVPITLNTWYHVAMTWDSTTLKMYLNGSFAGSTTCGALTNVTTDMFIGPPTTRTLNGNIDMVNIFQIAKTQDEIKQIMRTEYPFVASGKSSNFFTVL